MSAFSKAELLACVHREIKQRERVYPRLIERGSMSADFAAKEIARMVGVLRIVEALPDDPPPPQRDLFGGRS